MQNFERSLRLQNQLQRSAAGQGQAAAREGRRELSRPPGGGGTFPGARPCPHPHPSAPPRPGLGFPDPWLFLGARQRVCAFGSPRAPVPAGYLAPA